MTSEWIKPLAFDLLCSTLQRFHEAMRELHFKSQDDEYAACYWDQCFIEATDMQEVEALEWAIAQQRPPEPYPGNFYLDEYGNWRARIESITPPETP